MDSTIHKSQLDNLDMKEFAIVIDIHMRLVRVKYLLPQLMLSLGKQLSD